MSSQNTNQESNHDASDHSSPSREPDHEIDRRLIEVFRSCFVFEGGKSQGGDEEATKEESPRANPGGAGKNVASLFAFLIVLFGFLASVGEAAQHPISDAGDHGSAIYSAKKSAIAHNLPSQ